MSFKARHLVVKYVKPIVWAVDPVRKPLFLQDFALLELDSAWQSLNAIPKVADPHLKGNLFQHALEELGHYDAFRTLARAKSPHPLPMPILKRESLLTEPADPSKLIRFLTYLHVGEKEVNDDFACYARTAGADTAIRETFLKVQCDEEHHQDQTLDWICDAFKVSKWRLQSWLLIHRATRAWKTFAKTMQIIGKVQLTLFLSCCYVVFAPIIVTAARKRFRFSRAEELKIFNESLHACQAAVRKQCR